MLCSFFFFFNDTATTEIYTLSLHDALPISRIAAARTMIRKRRCFFIAHLQLTGTRKSQRVNSSERSEEHTSELQSPCNLVCRLLLEKKKNATTSPCVTRSRVTYHRQPECLR